MFKLGNDGERLGKGEAAKKFQLRGSEGAPGRFFRSSGPVFTAWLEMPSSSLEGSG